MRGWNRSVVPVSEADQRHKPTRDAKGRLHCRPTAPTSCDQPTGAPAARGESIPRSGGKVPDNVSVRKRLKRAAARPGDAVYAALAVILATTLAATGCDDNATPVVAPTGQLSGQPSVQPAARDQLAGLAAAAKDKRYVATYTLSTAKRADRTVTVAVATDGSWVVAVPAGALGGLADIAIFHAGDGTFRDRKSVV